MKTEIKTIEEFAELIDISINQPAAFCDLPNCIRTATHKAWGKGEIIIKGGDGVEDMRRRHSFFLCDFHAELLRELIKAKP